MALRLRSAFELFGPVARGGMGEIWRAIHLPSEAPVAIKLAMGDRATDPDFAAHFRNEVHAAARLDHPHVIRVFDHGEVDDEVAALSEGRLTPGTPWMAMEWGTKGTLSHSRVGRWSHLRRVLLTLLDALAHAHARGVIHRDIKPSNVIICGEDAPRPGLKLADFGIAAPREAEASPRSAGTRYYSAPEQVEGRFRDQGPWTDLYSVGCLAIELSTGWKRLPGPGETLITRFAVPHDFTGWVRRLVSRDERGRWAFAADAARRLVALGDVDDDDELDHVSVPLDLRATLATLTDDSTSHSTAATLTTGPGWAGPTAITNVELSLPDAEKIPFLAQWRRPDPPTPPAWLEGAGLGLFGLRTPPFVGREGERQTLWDALGGAIESGRARALVITGSDGSGRSRLAEWLAERAHELGVARSLTATHGPHHSRHHGLTATCARALRCHGLPHAEALVRIRATLRSLGADDGSADAVALCELISPATEEDLARGSPVVRLESLSERHAVIRRYISLLAHVRPVVLLVDDAHHGPDSIELVRSLLAAQHEEQAPILVLVTAERAGVEELLALEGAEELALEKLSKADLTQLVRGLLGLAPRFVARALELSAGNPLQAVELVGEWVARGILELGDGGFVLREGATTDAATDATYALFEGRLAAADPNVSEALEIAAALGLFVLQDEWARTCAAAGVEAGGAPVDSLVAAGLARRDPIGWSFTRAGVRDALVARAERGGRAGRQHEACARTLESDPAVDALERSATHWIAAGRPERALDPLERAVARRLTTGDHRVAESYLALWTMAMDTLGIAEDDPRRARSAVLAATLRIYMSDLDEAHRALDPWVTIGERFRGQPLFVDIMSTAGRIRRLGGDLRGALAHLDIAEEAAEELGDRPRVAEIRRQKADVAVAHGDLETAEACFSASEIDFAAVHHTLERAHCLRGRAMVARMHERSDLAEGFLCESRALFAEVGSRAGAAGTENDLGDVARFRGNLEEAERHYREALRTFRAIESAFAVYAEANLALVLVARGQFEEADELLLRVVLKCEREKRHDLEAIVQACLLPCSAGKSAWEVFDARIERAGELLASTGRVDVEIARLAVRTAQICREAGETKRALRCDDIAIAQWTALGRPEEVAAVRASAREQ